MKHSTIMSLIAAASLAACQDATAPERRPLPDTSLRDPPLAAVVDSSAVWASLALDDAATRLLSQLSDGDARNELKRALHLLSVRLVSSAAHDAARVYPDAAVRALADLREQSGEATQPDLDAVELALDGAVRLLKTRSASLPR
jgi:hypothetical protein